MVSAINGASADFRHTDIHPLWNLVTEDTAVRVGNGNVADPDHRRHVPHHPAEWSSTPAPPSLPTSALIPGRDPFVAPGTMPRHG